MKKVFSNSDLAHTYAQRSQNHGRNANGSFYFYGDTLYSYGSHFPICKFSTHRSGETALLFTERTYSNTTAKQIRLAYNATEQYDRIFCSNPSASTDYNFRAWVNEAEATAIKLTKARKPEKYLNELAGISLKAERYAEFMGVDIPAELVSVLSVKDKESYFSHRVNAERLKFEADRRRRVADKIHFKEAYKKWMASKTSLIYTRIGVDFLKLNEGRVETTQGVKIPIEAARRLYKKIAGNTLKEGDKLLDYVVLEAGNLVKIGCHTFKRSYLLKFGKSV